MSKLVNDLIREGYLRTDVVIDAFSEISRIEFVPRDLESVAENNIALPIGHGQTISQPLTVAFMFELLEPKRGQNILDVGSGSGWTTALLSYIVGDQGRVTAIERIHQLCAFAKENIDKYGYIRKQIAQLHCQDGSKGYQPNAPYDRILVSAVTEEIPQEFKDQLKVGGKMVIPVHNAIWYVEKKGSDDFKIEKFPGFVFVPLVQKTRI